MNGGEGGGQKKKKGKTQVVSRSCWVSQKKKMGKSKQTKRKRGAKKKNYFTEELQTLLNVKLDEDNTIGVCRARSIKQVKDIQEFLKTFGPLVKNNALERIKKQHTKVVMEDHTTKDGKTTQKEVKYWDPKGEFKRYFPNENTKVKKFSKAFVSVFLAYLVVKHYSDAMERLKMMLGENYTAAVTVDDIRKCEKESKPTGYFELNGTMHDIVPRVHKK